MRALVTGAASGIGAATVRKLADLGATVTGLDLAASDAPASDWITLDVTDQGAVASLDLGGGYDALINAAGLPPRNGQQAAILAVNIFGLRAVTEAMLPALNPGASIINIASKAGARWRDNTAQVARLLALSSTKMLPGFVAREGIDPVRAYDLSKEAVIVWTKLSTERLLQRDLRMNCVSPAAVDTPILTDFMTAFGDRAEKGVAMTGRAANPDEIAQVVAWFAGPESGWVRGVNLEADGGLTAMLESRDFPAG